MPNKKITQLTGDASLTSGTWFAIHKDSSSAAKKSEIHNIFVLGNLAGDYQTNTASGSLSVCVGGTDNHVTGDHGFIGGGIANSIYNSADDSSAILGGNTNYISGSGANASYSVIGGGLSNHTHGPYSTILGGENNIATHSWSSVVGGKNNSAGGTYAFVGGGLDNVIVKNFSSIAGGNQNTVNGQYSFIGGGAANTVSDNYSVIVGGEDNVLDSTDGVIAGGSLNTISGNYAFIGGGSNNFSNGLYSVVVGGTGNVASGSNAGVVGGFNNLATGDYSLIGGGAENSIELFSDYSFVGGGQSNRISGKHAAIVGGLNNVSLGDDAGSEIFMGGGSANTCSGLRSVLVGGNQNTVTATRGTIIGGQSNEVRGTRSFVGGGQNNDALGDYSFIVGGLNNIVSGDYSFCLGRQAQGQNNGESILSDSTSKNKYGAGENSLSIHFTGGVVVSGSNLCVSGNVYTPTEMHSGNSVIDWSASNVFFRTGENTTFSFANDRDGQTITVYVTGVDNASVTWPTIYWQDASIPSQTQNGSDVYTFVKINERIFGSYVQNLGVSA